MGVHHPLSVEAGDAIRRWMMREERYAVGGCTTITTADGRSAPALIVNLSNSGCRIRTDLVVRPGEMFRFVLEPHGFVEAQVRWTKDGEAGLTLIARNCSYSDYQFASPP